jgi:hypothetical protein
LNKRAPMAAPSNNIPPVTNPTVDVAELLRYTMGDTGDLQELMSGFRIKVYHAKAFPWDQVLRALLYRDFRVSVTRNKADILIEAAI